MDWAELFPYNPGGYNIVHINLVDWALYITLVDWAEQFSCNPGGFI